MILQKPFPLHLNPLNTEMISLETLRHSTAHVLAAAVLRLFPEAKLDIGPAIESGFYYDFDLEHSFSNEDLERLEKEMQKIIAEGFPFERIEMKRDAALSLFTKTNQPYKISRLHDIPEETPISCYQSGEFIDLCSGPHLSSTKEIKAFKLLSVAGAYFRGKVENTQLQRIYGTAFFSKKELRQHLEKQEEAKKRDHRKLGKELELFHIDEKVGQGFVLWMPNGAILRQELQTFISEELLKQGYQQVFTPHIGKLDLFRTSGHFPYYKDSQFSPIVDAESLQSLAKEGCSCADLANRLDKGEVEGFLLKPMNCPMHIKIYEAKPHSYKNLPLRLAEFGTVYRWEQSGELNGMTRVRSFTQDDAHIFCTPEQILSELEGCLHLVKTIFETLGMNEYRVRIGLREEDASKYVGSTENWVKAEEALRQAAQGFNFKEEVGEAAFYGPKIDFIVKDVIGREWQLGTVQIDYNLPERFDLAYIGPDNQSHRPVMIHRAPFGSMERFCGVLIEHFAGNFPTWLAPQQVRILPINDELVLYGQEVLEKLQQGGIRASLDSQSEKLGAKIRRAEMMKIPHMLILGAKERAAGQVSVRSRITKELEDICKIDEFIRRIQREIKERRLPDRVI